MAKNKSPVTPALRILRQSGISFSEHLYQYIDHGGAARAASELDVDIHHVIKTLVLEDENKCGLLMLCHGDFEVALGLLARAIPTKRVAPCAPAVAHKHTGYLVGGTSPFGLRRPLPIYIEKTILDLPRVCRH